MEKMMRLGITRSRFCILSICAFSCVLGCNFSDPTPPSGRLEIEKAASWFQMYRRRHRGKAPKDEAEFVQFIEEEFEGLGETVDGLEMLTSPRDGQTFEMLYGKKAASKNPEENVAGYEREGYGGKKLVAFETGISKEVEETELQSLLAK